MEGEASCSKKKAKTGASTNLNSSSDHSLCQQNHFSEIPGKRYYLEWLLLAEIVEIWLQWNAGVEAEALLCWLTDL